MNDPGHLINGITKMGSCKNYFVFALKLFTLVPLTCMHVGYIQAVSVAFQQDPPRVNQKHVVPKYPMIQW